MGNKIAYVEAEVRPGQRLVQSLTYDTPTQFVSCQRVGIGGRKWWQFWKPRAVNVVTRFKNVANKCFTAQNASISDIGAMEGEK